jgi:hypothetical protein
MIVCITGMHRSGTSLAAQWLALAGLPLTIGGDIAPDISNPRGYYEDLDFVRLHAAHLRRINRFSFGWNMTPANFLHFNETERARMRAIIAARHIRYPVWGWKDPRTTLFLDDWKTLIPALKVMIIWRPCAMVVASLLSRGIKQCRHHLLLGPLAAIRLWKAHNRLACDFADRYPDDVIILSIDQIIAQSQVVLRHINHLFGTTLRDTPIGSFYKPDMLNRHRPPAVLSYLCARSGSKKLEDRLASKSLAI